MGRKLLDKSGNMAVRPLDDVTDDQGHFLASRIITAHEELGFLRTVGAIEIHDDPVARVAAVSETYKDLILPRITDDYFSSDDVGRLKAAYERGALLRRQMEDTSPELFRPPHDGLNELN